MFIVTLPNPVNLLILKILIQTVLNFSQMIKNSLHNRSRRANVMGLYNLCWYLMTFFCPAWQFLAAF